MREVFIMTTQKRKWMIGLGSLAAVAVLVGGVFAFRGARAVRVALDLRSQLRYLVEEGGTLDETPAEDALSSGYLEGIFGDDPVLLERLNGVVAKGLEEDPTLNLGEVTAMMVTYQKKGTNIENVVAYAVGTFPIGEKKPGFHKDGYFSARLDRQLWDSANQALSFLGRDVVLFAEEDVATQQKGLIDGFFSGDIRPIIDQIANPVYYTLVIPDPRRMLPGQLRRHVQALVFKGLMGYERGSTDLILLCPSSRAASYSESIIKDLKRMAEVSLRIRFGGIERQTEWGPTINPWWAYEMAQTLENSTTVKREQNIVRVQSRYQRVMVNALLKSTERLSRDLASMRTSLDNRVDPRRISAHLKTGGAWNYWGQKHQWGPDWPIPPEDKREASSAALTAPEQQGGEQPTEASPPMANPAVR